MAGGKGTRFWPRSVEARPKQFLSLTSQETMLQQTYARFRRWLPAEDVFIAVAEAYMPLVKEQLPEFDERQAIVEPVQRDTAACIALAAHSFLRQGRDDMLATVPADQYVPDGDALRQALEQAADAAAGVPSVVTLGIVPTRPEAGFGYIELEREIAIGRLTPVKAFIEKPSSERAAALIAGKRVLWNSGIYVWKPSTIAHFMMRFQPELWRRVQAYGDDAGRAEQYAGITRQSIDYAVMEKADAIVTIPVDFVWDDVGAWTSLERIFAADEDGNIAQGDVHLFGATGNIVHSETQRTVIIGASDLIVVSTGNGLLVCGKKDEQTIKLALERIADQGRRDETVRTEPFADARPSETKPGGIEE